MDKKRITALLVAMCALLSCSTTPKLRDLIEEIPAKNLEFYAFSPESALIERVNISSSIVMQYLNKYENPDSGIALYSPTADERSLLGECLELLPPYYRAVLQEKLAGIYFAENLFGTGIADYVLSEDEEIFAILILNPVALRMNISQLLTYKEKTNFLFENTSLDLKIEVGGEYSGLLYILTHECTHIVDYVDRITPYVEPGLHALFGKSKNASLFTAEYWDDYFEPRKPPLYKERLAFYSTVKSEKIDSDELLAVYTELETTPFVSLYSYLSWAEDLAEYCTMYHLNQNLGLTYTIRLLNDGQPVFEYQPLKNPLVLRRAEHLHLLSGTSVAVTR